MTKKKYVTAIFKYNDNISQLLTDASTFYNTLGTSPASGHVTIASAVLAAAKGRIAAAHLAETAVGTGTIGLAAARDLAVDLVIADIQNFVILVQTAVNNVLDIPTAIAIAKECGLVTKRDRATGKESFAVNNSTTSPGVLDFNFKASPRGVNACYETQMSTDNVNWIHVKTSTDSTYTFAHGFEGATILYFRGRVILSEKKGGAQQWVAPSRAYIIVL
jgi:hypothetical protein